MKIKKISCFMAFATLCALMSGCANLISNTYLHDPSLKEKTELAHDSFSALDSQPGFFDEAIELLAEAGEERVSSQIRRLNAVHDLSIATLIAESLDPAADDIWVRAKKALESDLEAVSPSAKNSLAKWAESQNLLEGLRAEVYFSERIIKARVRGYKSVGGKKDTECQQDLTIIGDDEEGVLFYNRFVEACQDKLNAKEKLTALLDSTGISKTEFHQNRDELKGQLDIVRGARVIIQKLIDDAKKAYYEEKVSFEQQAINSLTEKGSQLKELLEQVDNLDLESKGGTTTFLGQDLSGLGDPIDGQVLADAIRADVLGEELTALIEIMSDPQIDTDTPALQEAKKKYLLLVQSDEVLRGIKAFRNMEIPTPQSALMLLEHYRSQSAAFDRQFRHLIGLHALSVTAAEAAEHTVEHLLKALYHVNQLDQQTQCAATGFANYRKKCPDQSNRVAMILINMDMAHTSGTLPSEIVRETMDNNRTEYGLETSRGNAAHVIAILTPAIAIMKSYGDGGVKPETIAQLINTLSLISISVGVN